MTDDIDISIWTETSDLRLATAISRLAWGLSATSRSRRRRRKLRQELVREHIHAAGSRRYGWMRKLLGGRLAG